jgi:hypothetical protein
MKKGFLFVWFFVFVFGLSACSAAAQNGNKDVSQDNVEEYLRGTWRLDGELRNNNSGHPFHWFLEYTFSCDGTFVLTGYPPLSQKGKYRVLSTDEDKLILELYEQSGNFGTKDKQIEIVIDKEKERLRIDGKEGFTHVKKKQDD